MESFERERDVIEHAIKFGAHLSKNWTKEKQKEYNHWYYENKVKNGLSTKERVVNTITGKKDLEALDNTASDYKYHKEKEKSNDDLISGMASLLALETKDANEAIQEHYSNHTLRGLSEKAVTTGLKAISKVLTSISSMTSKTIKSKEKTSK